MSAPTLSEGTRTLPVMPVGQQAALDPYMALAWRLTSAGS